MGEWSDYFEDYPEENPANWVDGQFKPTPRQEFRHQDGDSLQGKPNANAELNKMISDANRKIKARSFIAKENCPQCGLEELSLYKISDTFYLCECQDCGIYGSGATHEAALEKTRDALGEGLDWRKKAL
jgi:Zn ribbon nucleic-acid-binding protein